MFTARLRGHRHPEKGRGLTCPQGRQGKERLSIERQRPYGRFEILTFVFLES
jgi:hypothetical protein